ncbi:ABC transporter permease [Marinilactibacillus sp. GCM10026970]|uniref:ABC transporter permease n=1 Tax=Marinilactibacillus sp. GCM10026970 TaxID=3252642 RepID=UPI00361C5673
MKSIMGFNFLTRFVLKKEWKVLFLWALGCLMFVFVGIFAFVTIYPSASDRTAMAAAMSNPAMEALFGKLIGGDNYTIGAMYSHTMTILTLALFSVASILMMIRNTRAEEEHGMMELIQSFPIGRLAHSTSALLLLVSYNISLALLTGWLLLLMGDSSMDLNGSFLTGAMYGAIGLFFGSLALLAAQLSSNSRSATMTSFSLLGAAYVIRIIGDTGQEYLTVLSPLGLLYKSEPFVSNRWWPVGIVLLVSFVVLALAFYFQTKRDLGAGLLPDKTGKHSAALFLKKPIGFVFRLMKTPLIAWTIGLILLGITYGSVMGDVESLLAGNELIEQVISSDHSQSIVTQFISVIMGVLAIAAVMPSIQVIIKLSSEEKNGRLQHLLVGTKSRGQTLLTFIAVSLISLIVIQVVQITAFGITASLSQDILSFREIFENGLVYLPAMAVILSLSICLFGWFPKKISLTWLALGYCFFILYFANLFEIPEWIKGFSPFYHIPERLDGEYDLTVLLYLTLASVAFSVIGIIGFKKRDTIH